MAPHQTSSLSSLLEKSSLAAGAANWLSDTSFILTLVRPLISIIGISMDSWVLDLTGSNSLSIGIKWANCRMPSSPDSQASRGFIGWLGVAMSSDWFASLTHWVPFGNVILILCFAFRVRKCPLNDSLQLDSPCLCVVHVARSLCLSQGVASRTVTVDHLLLDPLIRLTRCLSWEMWMASFSTILPGVSCKSLSFCFVFVYS